MILTFLEGPELIIVLVVIVLIFGASALPKMARSLGQAKKELDAGFNQDKDNK